MIGSGLFIRFAEVFEGFLPARRLHGEFFELNQLGTALAGRTTGRRYRLGDPIDVRVESIARNEGRSSSRSGEANLMRPVANDRARSSWLSAQPNQIHEFRTGGLRETRESDSESESGSTVSVA